jgi:hypothetical protein
MAEINKEDLFSDDALKAPLELAKNLGAVAASIDAITAASVKSEQQLKSSNSASKIVKETEQLTLQEKELLKVQNQISVALAKNNDEYIEHKRGLDAINKAVKEKVMAGREDQTLTAKLTKGLSDLKKELKEAKGAMLLAADAGGTMSKEYQDAAKKAGEMQDKISDAKDEAKVFANDTAFGALGTRIGLLKDKLFALDFKGVGEQLKGLGKIILANPLLLLAGIVIGIGAALFALKDKVKPIGDAFDWVGEKIGVAVQYLKDFSDALGLTTFAADEKTDAIVKGAEKEIEAIQKRYDREIALASSTGKDVVELEKKKWDEVLAEATKGVKELYGTSQRRKLTEEEKKSQDALYDIIANAINQKQIIVNKANVKDKAEREKAAKEEMEMQKRVADFTKKVVEGLSGTKVAALQKEKDARDKVLKELEAALGVDLKLNGKFGDAVKNVYSSINKALEKGQEDSHALRLKNIEDFLTDSTALYSDFSSSIGELFASVTASQLQDLEVQKRANKDKLDRDLEAAGNNEARKTELKKQSAKVDAQIAVEQLKLRQRQARFDKATALFGAGLNVALAITKAIPNPVLIALTAALGAIQVAAIAAKPIPAFATGTKSSPAGVALVGELGRELLVGPNGQLVMTPDKPTLMNLAKGTQVIPNDETMMMLAMAGIQGRNTVARDYSISNAINELRGEIRNGNGNIVDAVLQSGGDLEHQGSILYKVHKMRDGSRLKVRKKIMG